MSASVHLTQSRRVAGRARLSLGHERCMNGAAWLCMAVSGVLMVYLIGSFGWLVFGRYVLNDTPTWVEQSALVCVVYITTLGAAAGVHHRVHLSIDFLKDRLSGWPQCVNSVVANAFVIVFGLLMAWQGGVMFMGNLDRPIPMVGLSESWRAAPLVASGVLMAWFALAQCVDAVIHRTREGQ
ncbi:TRAP transporter small permease [Larsenimonas rhizosphaerae]|uniref:TRAP transporter small permease protein n=1 Tax=Larsenimonas rhizosphaerae TaxID=2944682 RepID=A0AA41ZCU0_9GAMM|nr:TRAP transporter small permease [Larsenimonas rhizosphaerae]MCM2130258.1 TRAP transporter small permease [Larsenimonas rhizosphaerae]MCX2522962.1 TRAP transporter small permease [Larsenimonas rhizosphaerae]